MATWDQPATRYMSKRAYTTPTRLTANWRDINWAALNKLCQAEQQHAVDTYKEERTIKYEQWLDEKEREYSSLHPESGSYEGNLRDEHPIGAPNFETLFRIERISSNKAIEAFIIDQRIKESAMYLMPQIIEHIGTFKLTTIAGEEYNADAARLSITEGTNEGLISAGKLYRAYFSDDTMMGLYNFLLLDSRSAYLETQYKAPARNFCALVPLIMYAFKLKGLPYSHWDPKQLFAIVNTKLLDAMTCDMTNKPDNETILAARAEGLLTKSGPKVGQIRNPAYTFKLFGKNALSEFPELAQVMLSQIWCAHPENRTKYMILDPSNWDTMPTPLISQEAINPTFNIKKSPDKSWSPWD